ncbi:MAG: M48 family metalloprotease [Xanthomonadaceae bacterium]|nr:M48 family metalloprotease [Xanthomonadaceae bacterium]
MNRIALGYWLSSMACAVLLVLSGCAVNPVTGKQDFVLLSEDEEIALGRSMHPQLLEQMPPYEDPALQAYVRGVGERLAQVSHRSNLIYRFTVLDSDQVNAFATPGGYIYITRGLLAYLNTEAELAAVLGHEIGHVTARHSVRQHSAKKGASRAATMACFPPIPPMTRACRKRYWRRIVSSTRAVIAAKTARPFCVTSMA